MTDHPATATGVTASPAPGGGAAASGTSLRAGTEAYHAVLMPHVDRLLTLAELIGSVDCSSLHGLYAEEHRFLAEQYLPHQDAVEARLYDRLESIMGARHTMAPMREEHRTVRALVEELGGYRAHAADCTWGELEGLAVRRALYRLHALLKVHLAEEEQYLAVLDRSLTDEEREELARALDHVPHGEPG